MLNCREVQRMGVAAIERWERARPYQRPKLPKLEHVALNSVFETGAKMHQNAVLLKTTPAAPVPN